MSTVASRLLGIRCVRCWAEGRAATQPCPNCQGYSKDAVRNGYRHSGVTA